MWIGPQVEGTDRAGVLTEQRPPMIQPTANAAIASSEHTRARRAGCLLAPLSAHASSVENSMAPVRLRMATHKLWSEVGGTAVRLSVTDTIEGLSSCFSNSTVIRAPAGGTAP